MATMFGIAVVQRSKYTLASQVVAAAENPYTTPHDIPDMMWNLSRHQVPISSVVITYVAKLIDTLSIKCNHDSAALFCERCSHIEQRETDDDVLFTKCLTHLISSAWSWLYDFTAASQTYWFLCSGWYVTCEAPWQHLNSNFGITRTKPYLRLRRGFRKLWAVLRLGQSGKFMMPLLSATHESSDDPNYGRWTSICIATIMFGILIRSC